MTILDQMLSLPLYLVNGSLWILYHIWASVADIITILIACVLIFMVDPYVQNRATARPRRYGRGAVQTGAPSAQYLTTFAAMIWLVVSQISPQPIPFIGAALWLVGLIAVLAVSEQRFNQLWWAKVGILAYAFVVLFFRFGIGAVAGTPAAEWAALAGSSADAQVLLANTRSNIVTLGLFFQLFIYPAGYAGLLLNKFLRNPKPLFAVFAEPGEVLRRIRVRG